MVVNARKLYVPLPDLGLVISPDPGKYACISPASLLK